jgi:hypothetical protein
MNAGKFLLSTITFNNVIYNLVLLKTTLDSVDYELWVVQGSDWQSSSGLFSVYIDAEIVEKINKKTPQEALNIMVTALNQKLVDHFGMQSKTWQEIFDSLVSKLTFFLDESLKIPQVK